MKSNLNLSDLIKNDERLKEDSDLKMLLLSMSSMYLDDFSNNLNRTSLELNDIYELFSIDDWKTFLNYPIIRKYINGFKNEKINSAIDSGVLEGKIGALTLKKALQDDANGNNSAIILMRLPEKVDL